MLILGIETSCDETVASLCGSDGILRNYIRSREQAHTPYGGAEVASREHVAWLMPMVDKALADRGDIDAVAFTAGPGLAGCLVVGAAAANAVAYTLGKPEIPVSHLDGHVLSPQMERPDPLVPVPVPADRSENASDMVVSEAIPHHLPPCSSASR